MRSRSPRAAAPSGAVLRHVATVLGLTLHARQGHASGGRSAVDLATAGARGRGPKVRAFRVTAVSAETLRTLREVLIFVDQSAELVVSSDVVERGSGAAGEWR